MIYNKKLDEYLNNNKWPILLKHKMIRVASEQVS